MNTIKKKNVVRLTESDLHNMVKQCVNEALNELDWKTYVNAARKAEKKKDVRKDKFLKQASKELNKKFPNQEYHMMYFPGGKNAAGAYPDFFQDISFSPYLNTNYAYMNAKDNVEGSVAPGLRYQDDGEFHKSFGDRGIKSWGRNMKEPNCDTLIKPSECWMI